MEDHSLQAYLKRLPTEKLKELLTEKYYGKIVDYDNTIAMILAILKERGE